MRKKVLFLMNFSAGTGNARQKMAPILECLAEAGCEVTMYPIIPDSGLTSESIIHERGMNFDVIACCGGDGTLNHVINAVMREDLHTPIGYIPSGSTNDFAKNLHGSLETRDLCRAIATGIPYAYDVGCLNGRFFNYVAGFGAFTKISYDTDQHMKNMFGYGAYILNMLGSLPKNLAYRVHATVEHDGKTEEGDYIFGGITNSTQIAGVQSPILSEARLNDGYFEALLVTAPNDLIDVTEIAHILASGRTDSEYVQTFKARDMTFRTERPVGWTVDGEYGGEYVTSRFQVYEKAVRIMINPDVLGDKTNG